MNKEIGEIIVKTFFVKRLQQRVLFELFSNKKRREEIERLDSTIECLLNNFLYSQ